MKRARRHEADCHDADRHDGDCLAGTDHFGRRTKTQRTERGATRRHRCVEAPDPPIISGGVFDEFVLDVGPQHHEHDRRHHKARQYRNARLGEQAATNQFQAQRLVRAFEDRKYTGVDE